MDFKNCTIKYDQSGEKGVNTTITVKYNPNPDGSWVQLSVPLKVGNKDYDEIMKWVAEGNVIEEAD